MSSETCEEMLSQSRLHRYLDMVKKTAKYNDKMATLFNHDIIAMQRCKYCLLHDDVSTIPDICDMARVSGGIPPKSHL
jgi:hypothetical protein